MQKPARPQRGWTAAVAADLAAAFAFLDGLLPNT